MRPPDMPLLFPNPHQRISSQHKALLLQHLQHLPIAHPNIKHIRNPLPQRRGIFCLDALLLAPSREALFDRAGGDGEVVVGFQRLGDGGDGFALVVEADDLVLVGFEIYGFPGHGERRGVERRWVEEEGRGRSIIWQQFGCGACGVSEDLV